MPAEDVAPRTASRLGLLVGLLSIPVSLLVERFSDGGRARAAAVSFAMILGGVWAYRSLRGRPWFWLTIAGLVLLHVLLVVLIPWTDRVYAAPLLWPIGALDFVVVFGGIALVERLVGRSEPLRQEQPSRPDT